MNFGRLITVLIAKNRPILLPLIHMLSFTSTGEKVGRIQHQQDAKHLLLAHVHAVPLQQLASQATDLSQCI